MSNPRLIVGVDIGKDGGLVALLDGQVLFAAKMPTWREGEKHRVDGARITELYQRLPSGLEVVTYMESIFAPRPQGRSGTNGALALGAAHAIALDRARDFGRVEHVSSRAWQSALGCNHQDYKMRKQLAIEHVKRRWPRINLQPGRCKVPQSGIADAACIAEYGQGLEAGEGVLRREKRRKDKPRKRRKGA